MAFHLKNFPEAKTPSSFAKETFFLPFWPMVDI
jgi:hypothetical protein